MRIDSLVKVKGKNITGIVKWIGADYPQTIKIKNLENGELITCLKNELENINKLLFLIIRGE